MNDLNAILYSNELFNDWANRKGLIPAEEYLLKKYLIDTTKCVLEAGTGGGRISFYIEKMGFNKISAFDIVPKMITHADAVAKKIRSNIEFRVADAAKLTEYKNETFDYSIYLQQVLCCIADVSLFNKALKEAYRITKKDGIVILSFLDYDARVYNMALSWIVNIARKIRGDEVSKRHLPWLKINDTYNWNILNKNQAVTYWVKKKDIISDLNNIGFKVLEAKNANQLSIEEKMRKGMLYIVCKK